MRWREIREAARVSRERAAVLSGVSSPTARLFEMGGPSAIKDAIKREALVATYKKFADGQRAA